MTTRSKNFIISFFGGIAGVAAGLGVLLLMGAAPGKHSEETIIGERKKPVKVEYAAPARSIPSKLSFCEEPVPLGRLDIRERFDRELLVNSYWQSSTLLLIKRANKFFPVIEPILKENGVPEDFKYLALIESNFMPRAYSSAGAAGIWQFLKSTGREYGLEVNNEVDERYHMEKATVAACKYFKKAYEKFGSWSLVAASYNGGRARIIRELDRQKVADYYDLLLVSETSRYLFRILAIKEILAHPKNYGFLLKREDLYPFVPTEEIEVKGGISHFADWAKGHGVTYAVLKDFNPWLRQHYLTNKSKKTYKFKIPVQKDLNFDYSKTQPYRSNWVVNP